MIWPIAKWQVKTYDPLASLDDLRPFNVRDFGENASIFVKPSVWLGFMGFKR